MHWFKRKKKIEKEIPVDKIVEAIDLSDMRRQIRNLEGHLLWILIREHPEVRDKLIESEKRLFDSITIRS